MNKRHLTGKIYFFCLFSNLLPCSINGVFIGIFLYWYCNQPFCIKSVDTLSPILFNVYMNDLGVKLNSNKCGCNIYGIFTNHYMSADESYHIIRHSSDHKALWFEAFPLLSKAKDCLDV